MASVRTAVIVNPKSGKLRKPFLRRKIGFAIEEALGETAVFRTKKSGDATRFTRLALKENAERVIAMGGDGTLSEVIEGFFEHGEMINPFAGFSFVMTGTGNDFQKSFETEDNLFSAIRALKEPREKRIDIGRLFYTSFDGSPRMRHFLNIASFGMSGAVDKAVNEMKWKGVLGGKLSFMWGSVRVLSRFKNPFVEITIDDEKTLSGKYRLVIVANGRYAGGGMKFAPNAILNDGKFDVVTFGDIQTLDILRNFNAIYKGQHIDKNGIESFHAKKLVAVSDEEVLLDVDGEALGRLPASFEILPKAIRLLY